MWEFVWMIDDCMVCDLFWGSHHLQENQSGQKNETTSRESPPPRETERIERINKKQMQQLDSSSLSLVMIT